MMPLRRLLEVEAGKVWVFEFGDEHGGYAVDGGAFLLLDRLQHLERVEYFYWYHGGAVGDAGHDPQDAAEAVEEGNGDAEAVFSVNFMHSPMLKPLLTML